MSQDDELALMAGYAAAMDASMSEGSSTQDVTTAIVSGTSSPPEMSEPQEGPSGIGRPPEDWESQTGEELDHTSLSMCVSEASCKKSRGESSQRWRLEAACGCEYTWRRSTDPNICCSPEVSVVIVSLFLSYYDNLTTPCFFLTLLTAVCPDE